MEKFWEKGHLLIQFIEHITGEKRETIRKYIKRNNIDITDAESFVRILLYYR